jgi:hypothetical protein
MDGIFIPASEKPAQTETCQQNTPAICVSNIYQRKTPGHCPGLCCLNSVANDQAAASAAAFRFLRQPSSPNAPRPVAKSDAT